MDLFGFDLTPLLPFIAVGLLMLTDMMSVMSAWLQPFTPEFLRSRL